MSKETLIENDNNIIYQSSEKMSYIGKWLIFVLVPTNIVWWLLVIFVFPYMTTLCSLSYFIGGGFMITGGTIWALQEECLTRLIVHTEYFIPRRQSIFALMTGRMKKVEYDKIHQLKFHIYGLGMEFKTKDGRKIYISIDDDRRGYLILFSIIKQKFPNIEVPDLSDFDLKLSGPEAIQILKPRFENYKHKNQWIKVN